MTYQKKILIKIAYEGTTFAGWQSQKNSQAIQPLIAQKLSVILRHPVKLEGSGRTDSGVHALCQMAHFETIEEVNLDNLIYRLNALLPPSIRILSIQEVDRDFHARFSVKKKTYKYLIYNDAILDPFFINKAWHISFKLDVELMKQAALKLQGLHDFKAFAAKNTEGTASFDSVRTLDRFDIFQEGPLIICELTSKGFLYKMVRNLVGCVVEIGSKKLPLETIDQAFETSSRHLIGQTAQACGLYLKKVEY
jgi:tRNA pseudouridine38-40 synthase